ncbi:MAG: hypothetical protein ACI4VT_00420 [Bacilli bacterium]
MRRLSESEYLYIESNFEEFICAIRAGKAGSYEDNPAIYDGLTEYLVRNLHRGQNLELYLSDLAFMINNVEGFPAINIIDAIVYLNDNTLFKLKRVLSKIYLVDENKYKEMLSQARMFLTPDAYLKLFSALSVKNKIVLNSIDETCLVDMINAVDDIKAASVLFENLSSTNKVAMKGIYNYLVEHEAYGEIVYALGHSEEMDVDIVKHAIALLIRNTDEDIVVPCSAGFSAKEKDELFEYLISQFANNDDLRYKLCDNFIAVNSWLAEIYTTYGKEDFAKVEKGSTKFFKKLGLDSLETGLKDQDKHNKQVIDFFLRLGVLGYEIDDDNVDVIDYFFERRIGNSEYDASTYLIYHDFIVERKKTDERTSLKTRLENIVKTDNRYLAMRKYVSSNPTPSPIYSYLDRGSITKKDDKK